MKKKIIISLLLITLTFLPISAKTFSFGVKGGVTLSTLSFKGDFADNFTSDNRAGFFVGPTAKIMLPIVGLGIEGNILYSQSSSELEGESITRRSIEVPVYLRYEFSLPVVNKFLEPFAAVGPQFGWAIGDRKEAFKNVAEWEYEKSNISLNVGAGATILNHIQLHINYNIALGNTGELKADPTSAGWDYIKGSKVNTWQVSAAYIF